MKVGWIFLSLVVLGSTAQGQGTDLVDRVVASVNTSVITIKQLEERTSSLGKIYANPEGPTKGRIPDQAAIRRRALDDLIDEELILQRSKENLRKEAAERYAQRAVEDQINDLREKLGEQEFQARLAEENQSLDEFKAVMVMDRTRLILVQQGLQSWLDEILLTPTSQSQVDKYLQDHPGMADEAGAPEVQFVFLKIPESKEPAAVEAVKNKAAKILARARMGEPFTDLVNQYSQHEKSKQQEGILPLLSRTSPFKEFGPLFDLEAGQVYPEVITLEGWFCIAKVKNKQSLYNLVRRKMAQEEQSKALAELRKEAIIILDHELFPSTEP